jgi:hypothetical protein
MDLSTIVLIVAILGAIFGAKGPWVGVVAGLMAFPLLYCLTQTAGFLGAVVTAVAGAMIAGLTGFGASFFYSGFKGKGHNTGPSYIGGFGGGRGGALPGGIVMSDEEHRKNK